MSHGEKETRSILEEANPAKRAKPHSNKKKKTRSYSQEAGSRRQGRKGTTKKKKGGEVSLLDGGRGRAKRSEHFPLKAQKTQREEEKGSGTEEKVQRKQENKNLVSLQKSGGGMIISRKKPRK